MTGAHNFERIANNCAEFVVLFDVVKLSDNFFNIYYDANHLFYAACFFCICTEQFINVAFRLNTFIRYGKYGDDDVDDVN